MCSTGHAVVSFTVRADVNESVTTGRLDKWLWSVRIFKTRSLATDACRAGSVEVDGRPAKPARDIRVGDTVNVRQGLVLRTLKVMAIPRSRIGASLVPESCLELTTAEEFAKARQSPVQHFLERTKGSGRPTKRDRRAIEQLLGL